MTAHDTPARPAARALVIDARQRVLLFLASLRGRSWWFAPGGAVERGETYQKALVRELEEETGLRVPLDTVGDPVWVRDYSFRWHAVMERHIEWFFVVRVDRHDVDVSRLPQDEAGVIREHRWWRVADMAPSGERFAPRRMPDLLEALVGGARPASPVELSD